MNVFHNSINEVTDHFRREVSHALECDKLFHYTERGYRHDFAITWDLWVQAHRHNAGCLDDILANTDKKSVKGAMSFIYTIALCKLAKVTNDGEAYIQCYVDKGTNTRNGKRVLELAEDIKSPIQGTERCVRLVHVDAFRDIVKEILKL